MAKSPCVCCQQQANGALHDTLRYLLVQLNNRVDPSLDAIDFGVCLVHKRPLPQIVNHAGRSARDIYMAV